MKKEPRIRIPRRIPSMMVRTGRKISDERGFEVQLGRNAEGRAINHISKIIPAALRSGRADRVGVVLLETPES